MRRSAQPQPRRIGMKSPDLQRYMDDGRAWIRFQYVLPLILAWMGASAGLFCLGIYCLEKAHKS